MSLNDLLFQLLGVIVSLIPLTICLLFSIVKSVLKIEKITGIKLMYPNLIDDEIKMGFTFLLSAFEVTPSYWKLFGSSYFIASATIILLDRFKILIMPEVTLCISLFMMCIIYPMVVVGLRKNTFNSFGLPNLSDFFIFKLWRWRYKELEVLYRRNKKYIDFNDKYYSSLSYICIASIVGFFPIIQGFSALIYHGVPFIVAFGIFMQTIVLFPDVWDKIMPLNFKKWTGGTFLVLLAITSWYLSF